MISVLPDSPFLANVKLQECNVCVRGGIMGVDGYAGMAWDEYMYICSGFNFVIS